MTLDAFISDLVALEMTRAHKLAHARTERAIASIDALRDDDDSRDELDSLTRDSRIDAQRERES